jgi:hypothetical protein
VAAWNPTESYRIYVPVEKRIWRRLVELADIFRTAEGDATVIPITQEDSPKLSARRDRPRTDFYATRNEPDSCASRGDESKLLTTPHTDAASALTSIYTAASRRT